MGAKSGLIILATALLVWASEANAVNCDKKPDHPQCGQGSGDGGDDPPAMVGCPGDFPAIAYIRHVEQTKGKKRLENEIVLANAAGDCAVVAFTSSDNLPDEVSLDSDGSLHRLAWARESDEGDRTGNWHPNILYTSFTTSFDAASGLTVIDQVLPLSAVKVFRSISGYGGSGIVGLDIRGNQLVFGFEEGSADAGWFDTIALIGDLEACAAEDQSGDACVEAVLQTHDKMALWPHFGSMSSQIFFQYRPGGNSDGNDSVAVIQRDPGGEWSSPVNVITSQDLLIPDGEFVGVFVGPAIDAELDGVAAEYLALTNAPQEATLILRLQGEVGACPADADGNITAAGSCLASGYAEVIRRGIPGYFGRWSSLIVGDDFGGLDVAPNLVLQNGQSLSEWDPEVPAKVADTISGQSLQAFDTAQ